jgi:ABC-type transport system substrate-binding protein
MHRRQLLHAGLAGALLPHAATAVPSGAIPRTLRLALRTAEAGFDPPQLSDTTSLRIIAHIFEAPLGYDHLARPARLVPLTAAALPEVSDNFRRFVFTLRPGTFFADDPVFGGRPRELVAADYV